MVTKGDSYYIINFAEGDRPGDLEGGEGLAYRLLQVTGHLEHTERNLTEINKTNKNKTKRKIKRNQTQPVEIKTKHKTKLNVTLYIFD